MPTTPVFGWPYQARSDAPNGPTLGEQLALAIEATLSPISAAVAKLPRMGVTLRRAATQALPDATDTTASWDTEDEDTNGLWAIGTPTIITIPAGGTALWAVTFGITSGLPSTARSFLFISPSNAPWAGAGRLRNSYGAGEDTCSVSGIFPMSAGDTFTCVANVDMSGASTMTARLTAYRVGA